ncbi:hypothetical protein F5B19DRAFT_497648 [Rostrohypoxylon terebratum]|nr:hypothetical protein F5B19DRAFT_497648 [Rostrohypoxylon terebratum]
MASIRSDEAVQGDVRSDSKPAPDPSYASARIHQYTKDATVMVNVNLALAQHPSHEAAQSGLDGPIQLQPVANPVAVAPALGTTHGKADDVLRGVGSRFDSSGSS